MKTASKSNCLVFLTHLWTPAVAAHFDRLRAEAADVVDVFLAFQAPGANAVPDGAPVDILVTPDRWQALQPERYAECLANGGSIYLYSDLVMMVALNDPKLGVYDHRWFVEYDVEFSGNWRDFFAQAVAYEGDMLAVHICMKSQLPDFDHWYWYAQPDRVALEPARAFFPISRFSRAMLATILQELSVPGWKGFFEMVYPTIAFAKGLSVVEIGGMGRFTPAERRGRHYTGRTFTFTPPRSSVYFEQRPGAFRYPNRLYHPVKTDWSLRRRIEAWWVAGLRRLENHDPRVKRVIRSLGLTGRPSKGMPPGQNTN